MKKLSNYTIYQLVFWGLVTLIAICCGWTAYCIIKGLINLFI